VAVKVFRLDITPEQAQSLAEELARAAEAGLFHPSIVEPLAAGVEGTVAYRAEEYVAAETLDVAMRHYAPAPLETALPFVTQLAGAIDFARAAGVGHGALHPRDIFVTPEEARATGFGVVDALERVGLRAPVRRPYSPPERIAGEAWGTPADIFSLGAIAFELLTGRRPSGTGEGIGALNAGPDSDRLRRVLARAMHDDPAARYPTALAFAAALEGSGETASVVPFKPVASPEREPRPEPAPAPIAKPAAIEPPAVVAPPPHSPAPVVPPPPAPPAPVEPEPAFASEPDDIAAERDEDIAHWNYSVDEARASEVEADEPPTLFDDREQEAAADELFLDAADLTLNETRGAKQPDADARLADFEDEEPAPPEAEPEPEPTPPVVPYLSEPRPRAEHAAPRASLSITSPADDLPLTEPDRDTRFDGDDSRRPMTPIAIAMVLGLLLGALAMYAYLSKRDTRESISTAATPSAPAAPATTPPVDRPTGPQTPPPTKEFSERAVTPPGAPAESAGRAGARAPAPKPPAASASPSPPAALRTARLIVNSTPVGASVTINGRWRGRTPLTLDELPLGNYVVRIVATGYDVYREDVLLSSSQESRTISERLKRSAPAARGSATQSRGTSAQPGARPTPPLAPVTFVGSIYVDSRPRGAKVFIDGKEAGTTPLKKPELSIGAHVIRLELKDHHTWTSSVRITSGEEQRVTGSLEPIR
jgi:serine/threonine protein kinase